MALVAQVAQLVRALLVEHLALVAQRVALVALAVSQALLALTVLVSSVLVAQPEVLLVRVAHLAQPVVSAVQAEAQAQDVAAESVAVPLVLSVRAVPVARARLESQSARNAKSSNSVTMPHHLVERLFHAVMAQPLFASVAVHLSKISQTRLKPQRHS